jgi:hypothetical protein
MDLKKHINIIFLFAACSNRNILLVVVLCKDILDYLKLLLKKTLMRNFNALLEIDIYTTLHFKMHCNKGFVIL